MNQQKQQMQKLIDCENIDNTHTVNPEYSLNEHNSSKVQQTEVNTQLIDNICAEVSLKNYESAHQMASLHAFIQQLLLDHLEIDFLSQIYSSQVGTPHFSKLQLRHPLLSPVRLTRIRGFYSLKSSKSLNVTLVSSLSRNLEDLIEGRYQPRTGSEMFETVYSKLNRLSEMLKSADKGSAKTDGGQVEGLDGSTMLERNVELSRQLEVQRREKKELDAERLKYMDELCVLKKQQGNYQRSMLELRHKHLLEMQAKNRQFKAELITIRNLRKNSNIQTTSIYQQLDVSIQDFKDLIIKLSQQNKILREEREILLAKLSEVYHKIEAAIIKETHSESQPIDQKQDKLELLLADIAAKDKSIRQLESELQSLRQYKAESERQRMNSSICDSSLDNSRSFIEGELSGGRRRIQRTNTDRSTVLRDKERKIRELQAQIKEDNFTIQELTDQLERLQNQIEKLDSTTLEETIRMLAEKIAFLQAENENLSSLLKEKDEKASTILQQQNQDAIIERNLRSMTEKMQKLQQNLKTKEKELSQQRHTISSLNSALHSTLPVTNELAKENELLNSRIDTYTRQSKLLADSLKQREEEMRTIKDKHRMEMEELEFKLGEQLFQLHEMEAKVNEKLPMLFCSDNILDKEQESKDFLRRSIQQRYNSQIHQTKLLYKLDPLNKTNLNAYIDNHSNLLIIVKLTNDFLFAVYSQGQLSANMASEKDGILISLSKQLVFEPTEKNCRVLTYDERQIIVGNSEVKINMQTATVFSNFGSRNGRFRMRGMREDVLLGTSEKEVSMQDMQIYNIEFS